MMEMIDLEEPLVVTRFGLFRKSPTGHLPLPWQLVAIATIALATIFAAGCGAAQRETREAPPDLRTSVFAGGCFWCLETAFEGQPGVYAVVSGYAGGEVANPTYEQVSSSRSGHYEVVQVSWSPSETTYERLLEIFWTNVDPTDDGGQFCDRGPQYRTAVFAADSERALAKASLEAAERRLGQAIVTPILDPAPFYPAEDYHQDFWLKSPVRYKSYRLGCGRDARLEELWGPPEG